MKIVSIIFIIYFILYLEPVSDAFDLPNFRDIFGFKPITPCDKITSISMIAYNRQNPNGVEIIKKQDTCRYIDSKKIAFVIHGFYGSPKIPFYADLSLQLVKNDITVFSVNWSEGSCTINLLSLLLAWPAYDSAAKNTREAGKLVANYIAHITSKCKVPLRNIMLIGHSLGAHVTGFAAKSIKSRGIGTITHIIGVDPAGPHFWSKSCDQRLCDTDAKRVTALHTTKLYGINKPIGHVNLYFDDATIQPACKGTLILCSHLIAVNYLTALLEYSNCGFPGVPQLKKFDESMRPNSTSTNCIFVDRKIIDRNNIKPGAYTVFVTDKYPFCSQNTFPKCQQ